MQIEKKCKEKVCIYKNFIIYKCYSSFNNPYYTIINLKTRGHVHASSLKIAKLICNEAILFLKIGTFNTTKLDIRNRAAKLAIRVNTNKET